MLAQDKVVQIVPQSVTTISKLDLSSAVDSIFIIKSLLVAIVKDCAFISIETELAISKLKPEIISLKNQDRISDLDFFHIDEQFYLVLSNIKGFERLANIILKEKLHIDRILRLCLKQQESYKPIIRIYGDVLDSIQSNNSKTASDSLGELADILKENAFKAKKHYPEFFKDKRSCN